MYAATEWDTKRADCRRGASPCDVIRSRSATVGRIHSTTAKRNRASDPRSHSSFRPLALASNKRHCHLVDPRLESRDRKLGMPGDGGHHSPVNERDRITSAAN